MMDSPEPSKIKRCSSALNAAANTPSSESPQVQESPFLRFASNLSPMRPPKACHAVGQGFLGLSSPPLVFKSPRVNCHRESQYLERAQGTQSTSGEISQSYNGGSGIRESLREAPGDSNETNSQLPLPERFTTGTQQDFDLENDTNTPSCSPPTSIDEYLADPGDTDEMYSVKPDAEQSSDAVESAPSNLTRTKKYILKCKGSDDPGDKAEEPLPLSEESNEVHQERPAHVENLDTEGGNKVVEWVSQEHTKLESNLAADVSHNSLSQHAGKERDHSDCIPQSMPDPLQGVKESKDCHKMVSTLHVKGGNISQDGSEASLKHHGIRRRLLLFEEAATSALGSNTSYMKLTASSRNMNIVNLSEPVTSLYPQRGVPVTGSKPAGIGLHLNSIINAMPPGPASTTGMRSSDGLRGMQSTCSISLHKVETMKRYLISSNMDRQSLVDNRDEIHETDASLAADCLISESPSLTEPIASYHASEHDKRKLSPTDAGNSEEFNQLSIGKKKKKTSSSADDNGCKRCNCKKSKCLKLYCDCFAAGIFCRDSCSCQDCFNKPEHDDKVTEARQQIESRNPLAFAPKIVQSTTNVLSNMEDVNLTTPSSARHKRGCNCKRSMCLKKYCECYQSNVGCSSGCRCEGCKNVYGRKEDFVASEHALSKEKVTSNVEKGSDSTILVKPEMVASREDLSRNELYDQHHLSPITPSLQCSDQGKEAANSRLVYGKYLPSPDSVVNMFSSRSTLILTDSCDSQIYCNNENVRDQSSPPRNSAAFIAQVTPRSNPDSTSGAPSFPAKPVWTNGPPSRVSQGCIRQISGGSLRWRSSPNTPMRTSSGEAQHLQGLESDSRLFDIVEDETPAILKESSTPTKPVKVNSPIQKRVSPPRVIGSSSSGGLKNGRKFILKSVPSFPPLTPCVDSKGNSNKDSGNDDDATK